MIRNEPFTSLEEVNEYLELDPLPCLICGKEYHGLHKHIATAHGVSADEYRAMFGIPWRRGLISPSLREKQATIMNQQREEGTIPSRPTDEHIQKLRKAIVNRRPQQPVVTKGQSDHALRTHQRDSKLSHRDFEEFRKRIASGRTITEVGNDPDMMRRETFDVYCRENLEFGAKVEETLDNLPIAVQIRGQRTGDSFKQIVVFMREVQGKSWPQIASLLSVVESTPRNTYFRMKHSGELAQYRLSAAAPDSTESGAD